MKLQFIQGYKTLLLVSITLLLSACAAGDTQFTEQNPAGFFTGYGLALFP